jgi:hypothetical protein
MAKTFRASVKEGFEIAENGKTVGCIRIQLSGISWSPQERTLGIG